MTWNDPVVDGDKSVAFNETKINENTDYISTKVALDHFWDEDSNKDGHHQWVQSPKIETGGSPSDPTLATAMDGVFYFKQKTNSESPANEDVQSFFRNSTAIMQLLGIRACCLFNVDQTTKAITLKYSHNISTVTRTSSGRYKATFPDLPSANYLVLGASLRSSDDGVPQGFWPEGSTDLSTKTTTTFDFQIRKVTGGTSDADLEDPLQAWFVVFGG